jgi:hypothetical protein
MDEPIRKALCKDLGRTVRNGNVIPFFENPNYLAD